MSVPVARYKFASDTRSQIYAKSIIAAYYKSWYLSPLKGIKSNNINSITKFKQVFIFFGSFSQLETEEFST